MKKNVFGCLAAIVMTVSAGNAFATAQLVKSASYEHGLINSYVFEHPDTKMFVSPILWNRPGQQVIESSSGKTYGYRFGTNIGSGYSVGATRGSPSGKLMVPAISGTYANHLFQVREDAMVFYKDHQNNWKVGLSAQHGLDPVRYELSSSALKTVTDQGTVSALNDAADIFAGHYILTNTGQLIELAFTWGYGAFSSVSSSAILNDVTHVRAVSGDQLAAITRDNKIYRLTKNESPVLLGTISSGLIDAAKESATLGFGDDKIIIQDGRVIKDITGNTLYVIRKTSHLYQDEGNTNYKTGGVFLDENYRTSTGLEIPIGREFVFHDEASFAVEVWDKYEKAAIIAERSADELKITTGTSTVGKLFAKNTFTIAGLPDYGKLLSVVSGGGGTDKRTYVQHPEHGIVYLDRFEYAGFQTINHLTVNYERGSVFIPIKAYKDKTLTTPQYVLEPVSINGDLVYFSVENQKMIPNGYAIDPIAGGLVNAEGNNVCRLSAGDLTVHPGSYPQRSVGNPALSGYTFYTGAAVVFGFKHQYRAENCVDRATFAGGAANNSFFYVRPWAADQSSNLQMQHRQAGATTSFSPINFLDRAGYPSQPLAAGVQGENEALIAPFTVMGLNANGSPYIRGVISRQIDGGVTWEAPTRFFAVADNLLLDTGALYLDDASATKGKHADKIVASWKSNGQSFTVTPKRCNKSGSSCTNFEPSTLAETQFTHDSTNGLDSTIKQASLNRMFYQVEAERTLDIYPASNSTTKRTVIETKTTTTSPGYLSSPPTSTSGHLIVDSNTDGAIVQVTSNDTDEDNNHRYEILTQPQNGTARIGADGTIRYSVGNYHGSDTLTYRLHDGAGYVDGVASITVACPAPEILSVTPPASAKPWDSNLFGVSYRANACNGTQLNLRISAGAGSQAEVPRYTKVSSVASSTEATNAVTNLVDPDPGTYVVRVEVSSVSIPTNKRSEVVEVTVNGYSQAVLDIDNATPNEDQMITAKAYLSGGECAFYPTEQLAKNSFGCFATWNNTLYATSNSVSDNKSKISGYAPLGGPHQVVATIYKVDNSRTPRYVATAQQSVNVAPGAGVTFTNPVFPKNQRQFVDFVDFSVNVANESDCVVTTSETMALAEALAGQKVCLVEYSKLPAGFTASSDGTTRVTGRIESVATPALVEYKVSKYYANRPKTLALTETFTIPVDASVMAGTLTLDRPEYAKGLQVATATASITGNPTCTITNSTIEAKTSHGKAGTLACYGEWNNLPSWLTARPGSRLNVAGTVPATAGDYPLSYSLYMIDAADKRTLIGTYSGNVKVVNVSQIDVTIQGSGRSLENAAGETIYSVDHNGRVGSATFTAGQFSTVRTTITQGASVPIVMSGIKSGDTKEITIPGTSAPAWEIRTAQLRVEYEGISDTSQTRTQDVKVAQLPPMSSLSAIIFRPSTQLVDTESFALDAAIGVPSGMSSVSYLQSSHGRWRGWLASKEADALVPITPKQDANAFGEFRFLDLTYQTVIGKSVVLVAEPILPSGLTLSAPLNLVSDVQRLEFASGGPILAAAFVDKPKGMAPHTARFSLQVSQQVAANLGVTTWEVSSDGGSTWEALSQIGTSSAHVFADGGRYLVRANMSNKHSGVMSTTDPIVVNVGQLLSLTLTANERQIPGYPAVVTLDVQRILGGSIDHDSEWVVTSNDGQRITRNNISEITLESDKPASYDITVRAKPRFMSASDNETWTTVRKQVQFAWPEPVRISIVAPKRTEVGVPVVMTAKVTSRDMVRASNLTLLGEWILPEGATTNDSLDGETINVTFDPEAWTNNSNADVQYRAWLNEARDKSETLVTHRTQISKYEFARFVIKKKSETAIAPAYLRIQVEPADTNERKKIGSQKITYAWSVPEAEGLTAKVSGNSLTITATTPGEYPVVVEVQDERGNTQELNYDFVVQEPGNHAVSLGLKSAQKFNRPPMKYSLRPVVTGGHPSDKITKFDLFLNDDLLSSSVGSRPPRTLLINESGQHTIKLVATSAMEKVSTGEEVVTVNENANPVCEDIKVVWDRKGTSASVTSKCSDTDGRIKSYRWLLNGEVMEKRTGNRVSLSPAMIGSSSEVTFQVTDDSGGMTEQRVTLSPPGATFR